MIRFSGAGLRRAEAILSDGSNFMSEGLIQENNIAISTFWQPLSSSPAEPTFPGLDNDAYAGDS